ncbi:Cation-transporting ATPase, putative [Perkinsus marinus ATCC 50983]|uniref:Cation-transporting ATPase, putative n=1 Tax=Perkinsus marinus (strain ATCC 50983 / TXsc) TaxID=423536 RepID=C5LRQ0_PERM5|nr:Cation-transporting ATPase, putative [Perkinsus marinus ATCC 50983]EER00609.1 Cation-transporting ATPase, putative [Perkinsus marinus ATCC 50983]|eukprot:XP_002767891.1 Cation-transporting ATPase, putative [Perkinsus marinus ATCC 50983]
MVFFAIISYFPDVLTSWGTDWNGVMGPWLYVFVLFHVLAAIMITFFHVMRVNFMLPEVSMREATHVLIEEEVDAIDESDMVDPGMTDDEAVPGVLRQLVDGWNDIKNKYKQASCTTLVPVMVDKETKHRGFEYTCVRYLYDEEDDRFRPVGAAEKTADEAHALLKAGGLTFEEANDMEKVTGPNAIRVRVPGILESILVEFCDVIYVFQSIGAWSYVAFSTWNIGIIWLAMMLGAGLIRALFIVRVSQKKIANMAKLETRVHVLRDGEWVEVGSQDVVLGDLVRVEEQDPLPCDGIVVSGTVIVNESMLTGEPMPIQKFPLEDLPGASVGQKNCAYAGTICMQSTGSFDGKAVMLCTAVGALTSKGQLVRMVLFPQSVRFKYNDQLPIIYTIMFCYAMLITVLYATLTDLGSWIVTVLQILNTIAQSMNPMLPVSMVMGQSVSSKRLERNEKIACLQPGRIPVAGKISTMVFDKTGTITKDGMDFAAVIPVDLASGAFLDRVVFDNDLPVGDDTNHHVVAEKVPLVLQYGLASCHTVTSLRDGSLVGNHVDVAMLTTTGWSLPDPDSGSSVIRSPAGVASHKLEVVKALDFDHKRMTSGAVVRDLDTKEVMVIVKGSYERIHALSVKDSIPADFVTVSEGCAADNFYTLAMAIKTMPSSISDEEVVSTSRDELEDGLRMCGLLLFRNEMKHDSPAAIQALKDGNVRSVVCTGDNVLTGVAIAKQCHILDGDAKEGRILIGDLNKEINEIVWSDSDTGERGCIPVPGVDQLAVTQGAWRYLHSHREKLEFIWEDIFVFARMKPEDKVNVTKYLQSRKLVVGMCGDGGNDCGALRAAHAGMALSDAEASMVSPFSSGRDGRSLFTVVDMIREGRACLTTQLATYSFFIVYGYVLTCIRLSGTIIGNINVGEWVWLTMDIMIGVIMVWTMTLSGPTKKLAKFRPTASLLGWRTILACAVPIVSYYTFQIITYAVLWSPSNSSWYQYVNTLDIDIPPKDWMKKGDNYDAPPQVFMLFTVLVTQAYVATYGGHFRKNIVFNWAINILYGCFLVMIFCLLWEEPSDFPCVYRVNCDTGSSLETKDIPLISQYSVGDIGGCFLGPQVRTYQLSTPAMDSWIPDPAYDCRPNGPGSDIAIEEYPWSSPEISTLGYDGPNNAYPRSYRLAMTWILVGYIVLQHLFVQFGLLGPVSAYLRKLQMRRSDREAVVDEKETSD